MGLRDAINSVPAKPIIATAVAFTVAAAGWHGWNLHQICSARAGHTKALQEWAKTLTSREKTRGFIEDATDFNWDSVRISQGSLKLPPGPSCPFGWHWSAGEREDMAAAGRLTLFGFFLNGSLVEIVDFDSTWAAFNVDGGEISRERAVFVSAGEGALVLQQ